MYECLIASYTVLNINRVTMHRSVGIPGCGVPTVGPNKNLQIPHHQESIKNQFSYNINQQHIPHDTTNIYSSYPRQKSPLTDNEFVDDVNIPGAFMKNINGELDNLQSDQNEINKNAIPGGLSDTRSEETSKSTPTSLKTLKTSSVVQESPFYPNSHKKVSGFISFNDIYNSTIPFDFGSRNFNLSTSSCKEISSSFNKTYISTPKKFVKNTRVSHDIFQTKTSTINTKGPSGKWNSLVFPWERSVGNRLISTASAREISYQTTKPTTSISQPFTQIPKYSSDIFYDAASIPPNFISNKNVSPNIVSSNTGARTCFSTPWEMGFNNKIMSTASLKEISYQTKRSVKDIPSNFNKSKNPISKYPKKTHVQTNVISSGTGAGASLSTPWEMGFNNRKLSTSSAREISTRCNKTVSEIPIPSVNKPLILPISNHILNDNFDMFSSNTGALSTFCYPWEMGFNNRSVFTSTAREISNRCKRTVIDISQGFQTSIHSKKNILRHVDLPTQKNIMFSVTTGAMSMGFGSGMSLSTPNNMGFSNILMSSSSIQELSEKSKNTVLECSQGFSATQIKQETYMNIPTTNTFKNKNIGTPVIVGANLGPRNPFVSPQDMGFDNKPLSISSLREISQNTNKTVYSPNNILTLGSTMENPDKEGQNMNQNVLLISSRNIVGSNVAAQGPSQSKFYPPLGIKGLLKSSLNIYSPSNRITDKNNISKELQEPLEGAFMPNAIAAREFGGETLLHDKPIPTEYTTSGKYHLLFEDLHDSRITTNVFSSNLIPLKADSNLTPKRNDVVSFLDSYSDQNDIANKPASTNQGLQGNLIALSSLPTIDNSINKSPINEHSYQPNSEVKPNKNELIALDSILEKKENSGRSGSSTFSTQPTTVKTISSELSKDAGKKRDYWKFVSDNGRTRILQGSRRSATEDQIIGRTGIYLDFTNPVARRRSLGSITDSNSMTHYPSLIDPNTPTYGFYRNIERPDLSASNEYYVSNPITEVHKKRLSLTGELSPTNLPVFSETMRNEESSLEMGSDKPPDINNSLTPNSLRETVPRSYVNTSVTRHRPVVRKQSPRRKSNASIIFGKITQVITKSTI